MLKQLSIITSGIWLLLCISTTSFAADQARPYINLIGGLGLTDEMKLSDNTGRYTTDFDTGFFIGGAFGYNLGDGFPQLGKGRIELEIGYRYNELKNAKFSTGKVSADGDLTALSFMLNTIAEYEDYSPSYIPYVGIGLGAANISMNNTKASGFPMIDDDSTQFAYQFLAGISIPVSETLTTDLGYRYFSTLDPEFKDSQNRSVDGEYTNHSFEVGLRFKF